jgi:hypothetical protein
MGDLHDFIGCVAGEREREAEAGRETFVGCEESPHRLCVARGDHHEFVAVVLHEYQQRVDGFLGENECPSVVGTRV